MDPLQHNILSCFAYFDIFDYPLKKEEIHSYTGHKSTVNELETMLAFLTHSGWIFTHDEFYSLHDNYRLIERRREGNEKAAIQLTSAMKAGAFLSSFPFVRGIGISGSLSKNFADKNSDVDFFIITAKNRLWLARSFMHLFRKLALFAGKHNWFCMNYYIDEEALEIKEKNIFTAIELVTVIPVRGKKAFEKFYGLNNWTKNFLPYGEPRPVPIREPKKNLVKWLVEKILNNRMGDKLDKWLMQITMHRWQRKTAKQLCNSQGILLGMDANRHYSKPSPDHLQAQILGLHQQKMEEIMEKFEATLSRVV